MPELLGVVSEDDENRAVVALVFEHIAGARDGWEWFFEEALAVVDETASEHHALRSAAANRRVDRRAARRIQPLRSTSIPNTTKIVGARVERRSLPRVARRACLDEVRAADHPEAPAVLNACRYQIAELIETDAGRAHARHPDRTAISTSGRCCAPVTGSS